MSRLQSVQNAAARLITGVGQCEHITPALRQLHWLLVRRRVDFTAGPTLWNSLPEQLQQPDITFGQFKPSLAVNIWLVGPRRPVSER